MAERIGIFDSGLGGLSIYAHLRKALPQKEFLYYADNKNLPYGNKSPEQIIELTAIGAQKLLDFGAQLLVIACNSASAYSLKFLRMRHPNTPIVGLVPAIKPALLASQTGRVAILATKATLDSARLASLIAQNEARVLATDFNEAYWDKPNNNLSNNLPANTLPTKTVQKIWLPELVPWVENAMPDKALPNATTPFGTTAPCTTRKLAHLLYHLQQNSTDALVLGCTHYPFFAPLLRTLIAQNNYTIRLFDSGAAIANRVLDVLPQARNLPSCNLPHRRWHCTNTPLYLHSTCIDQQQKTQLCAETLLQSAFIRALYAPAAPPQIPICLV